MATGHRMSSAVRKGDLMSVQNIISSYGLYYSPSWLEGYALLVDAVIYRHNDIVKLLLEHGCRVNFKRFDNSPTPLHFAIRNGDKEIITVLVNKGADVLARDNNSFTSLHLAALKKDGAEIIEIILSRQNIMNLVEDDEKTPLHLALLEGYTEVINCLLNNGASVHTTCKSSNFKGYSVFHLLIEGIAEQIAEIGIILLSKGADINAKTEDGTTPLHLAARIGCPVKLAYLLKNGADVSASTFQDGYTPLYFAIKGENDAVVELLLKHGADIDLEFVNGKTILEVAVDWGDPSIVEDVLAYHPNVEKESNRRSLYAAICGVKQNEIFITDLVKYGFKLTEEEMKCCDLFHGAIEKGCLKIVEDIIKLGVHNINLISEKFKGVPLHTATRNQRFQIVKLLISHGADVNLKNQLGKSPLYDAIVVGDMRIVDLLLTNGAEVNDPDLLYVALQKRATLDVFGVVRNSNLFVTYESRMEHYENEFDDCKEKLMSDILSRGANANAVYEGGASALHLAVARENDNTTIMKPLFDYGAVVNAQDQNGDTPLHVAARNGFPNKVKALLSRGADPNINNDKGQTPLHLAVQQRRTAVVEYLLDYGGDIDALDNDGLSHLDIIHNKLSLCVNVHNIINDDFDDYDICDSLKKNYDVLQRHVIKLQTAGLPVSEYNLLSSITFVDKLDTFGVCTKELMTMREMNISNGISFYDVLTKNVSQLAIYTRNELFSQAFMKLDYSNKFPIYCKLIKNAFERGIRRNELIKKYSKLLESIFSNLPVICKDKIFGYLSNAEFDTFLNAFNPINAHSV